MGVIVGRSPLRPWWRLAKLRDALDKQGAAPPRHRRLWWHGEQAKARTEIVERTFLTARSIEFDAVVVAGGADSIQDIKVDVLLQEAYRRCKAIAASG